MIKFGHKIQLGFGSHKKEPGSFDINDSSILLWMNFRDTWFRVQNQSMMEAMRKLEITKTEEELIETIDSMKL